MAERAPALELSFAAGGRRRSFVLTSAAMGMWSRHPFTPYYDASKPEVLTGVVSEIRIVNPHVVLIVDVSAPEGRKGRWGFEGLPPHAFSSGGVEIRKKLQPGTPITISGWPAKDPTARVFSGREIAFADKSTMTLGPTPGEGDRWSCDGPCPYNYPEVLSR